MNAVLKIQMKLKAQETNVFDEFLQPFPASSLEKQKICWILGIRVIRLKMGRCSQKCLVGALTIDWWWLSRLSNIVRTGWWVVSYIVCSYNASCGCIDHLISLACAVGGRACVGGSQILQNIMIVKCVMHCINNFLCIW